ncbi:MAG: hypothetical protein GXP27_17100 [Planctomycetes bacterium]|nr:hypothetical protein [Planctomycetota bacterium]
MIRNIPRLATVLVLVLLVGCGQRPRPSGGEGGKASSGPAAEPTSQAVTERPADSTEAPDELLQWLNQLGARSRLDGQKRLVLVDLTDSGVKDADMERLAGQAFLKSVKLTRCPVTDSALDHLAKLPRLVSLARPGLHRRDRSRAGKSGVDAPVAGAFSGRHFSDG